MKYILASTSDTITDVALVGGGDYPQPVEILQEHIGEAIHTEVCVLELLFSLCCPLNV